MKQRVLTLPGWQGSGPEHWQSRWEALYGYERVEQNDWQRPLRGDWSVHLDEVMADASEPVVLVAHSLGCQLVVWWAAHSRHVKKVRAALLVAPPDVEQNPELQQRLHSWVPIARQPLPFAARVLVSTHDPYASLASAEHMSREWGAEFVELGALGHINAESGLGDWPEGHAQLQGLLAGR